MISTKRSQKSAKKKGEKVRHQRECWFEYKKGYGRVEQDATVVKEWPHSPASEADAAEWSTTSITVDTARLDNRNTAVGSGPTIITGALHGDSSRSGMCFEKEAESVWASL